MGQANNVLVTVSANPTVDQLAACIGLTVSLNKIGKHATAVFSGKIPSTIEFLEPEKTLEKNTDSLRDFIIALDKSKADKLRYKVDNENQVVKIFITPYRTSLSEKDLEFSQGDFNVDAVVALGVHDKADLDAAIVAHGRILHDAPVMAISTGATSSELGSLHWQNAGASSLCEMVTDLALDLKKDVLDVQIATSLLTGIVAETARFSNEKASPHTMSISGTLMSAGANQQLVATKLDEKPKEEEKPEEDKKEEAELEVKEEPKKPDDGTIQIDHDEMIPEVKELKEEEKPEPEEEKKEDDPDRDDIHIDEHGRLLKLDDSGRLPDEEDDKPQQIKPSSMILEPPTMGGRLTASGQSETDLLGGSVNPLNADNTTQPKILGRDTPVGGSSIPLTPPSAGPTIQPPSDSGIHVADDQTLSEIESEIGRTIQPPAASDAPAATDGASVPPPPPLNDVREKVEQIMNTTGDGRPQPPLQSMGSSPVDLEIDHNGDTQAAPQLPQATPPTDNNGPSGPPPPPVPPPMMPPAV